MQSELFTGSFDALTLPNTLILGLQDLGYQQPTRVQWDVFPLVLQGDNILVQSHTGTGKTTAFCLPILCQIALPSSSPQVLVLAPTRELVKQITVECSKLGHHHNVHATAIYGGTPMEAQIANLRAACDVVVATPGRLRDLLERGLFNTQQIRFCVLDEADEMLSMGFWEDVMWILSKLPENKQTLLFSATFPPQIESAIESICKNPKKVDVTTSDARAPNIRHVLHFEDESLPKAKNLLYALEQHQPNRAIVFCNRKDDADFLERYLSRFGFHIRALHGDLTQNTRETIMGTLRTGKLNLLIATDLAARGIDLSAVSHVFNYELPENEESYVHRCGRTGRIGQAGTVVNLIRGKNLTQIPNLEAQYHIHFEEIPFLPEQELLKLQADRMVNQIFEEAGEMEIGQYLPIANHIFDRADCKPLIAYLLKNHFLNEEPQIQSIQLEKPKKFVKPIREIQDKPRPAAKRPLETPVEAPSYARLYITLGREDGLQTLTELMAHVSQLSGVDLGMFTGGGHLREHSSHLEVEQPAVVEIVKALHQKPRANDSKNTKGPTITCQEADWR